MAYLALKYGGKSVKTYAGNLGHLTMSHSFFLIMKVVIEAIKMSMTFLFFAFFCMSIDCEITPQP